MATLKLIIESYRDTACSRPKAKLGIFATDLNHIEPAPLDEVIDYLYTQIRERYCSYFPDIKILENYSPTVSPSRSPQSISPSRSPQSISLSPSPRRYIASEAISNKGMSFSTDVPRDLAHMEFSAQLPTSRYFEDYLPKLKEKAFETFLINLRSIGCLILAEKLNRELVIFEEDSEFMKMFASFADAHKRMQNRHAGTTHLSVYVYQNTSEYSDQHSCMLLRKSMSNHEVIYEDYISDFSDEIQTYKEIIPEIDLFVSHLTTRQNTKDKSSMAKYATRSASKSKSIPRLRAHQFLSDLHAPFASEDLENITNSGKIFASFSRNYQGQSFKTEQVIIIPNEEKPTSFIYYEKAFLYHLLTHFHHDTYHRILDNCSKAAYRALIAADMRPRNLLSSIQGKLPIMIPDLLLHHAKSIRDEIQRSQVSYKREPLFDKDRLHPHTSFITSYEFKSMTTISFERRPSELREIDALLDTVSRSSVFSHLRSNISGKVSNDHLKSNQNLDKIYELGATYLLNTPHTKRFYGVATLMLQILQLKQRYP